MSVRQWTVDAFAEGPFLGNPACVVEPFATFPEAAWMQALAMENNQAETAFLVPAGSPGAYRLRWFTPAREAPMCGHATLAAAHVLFAELGETVDRLSFETLSGPLTVRRLGERYEMDFPTTPARRIQAPAGLAEALGGRPAEVWSSALYLTAILADEAAVRSMAPDGPRFLAIEPGEYEEGSLLVAALADPGRPYQVVSRFFAPGFGIPEDPTTGSAHTILAPLFSERLGRSVLNFHQAYPGRGGDLECEVVQDRVLIRGRAATVIESRLRFGP